MKQILITLVVLALLTGLGFMLFSGNNGECAHSFDNSCDVSCNLCGEAREASHNFKDADCDSPKTCATCGLTEGAALGHSFEFISNLCTDGSICKICSAPSEAVTDHIDENGDFICDRDGCEYSSASLIYTVEDLKAAFENGGKYVLMNDLDVGEEEVANSMDNPAIVEINLNGKTIQVAFWRGLSVYAYSSVRLLNGKVVSNTSSCGAITVEGILFLENMTIESDNYWPVYLFGKAKAVIDGSKLVGCIGLGDNGAAFISNTQLVREEGNVTGNGITISNSGYAVLDFDPTEFNQLYFIGTIVDNGDGTWYIAGSDFDGNAPEKPDFPNPENCLKTGHNFVDADCLNPKICINCFVTEGDVGEHSVAFNENLCVYGSYCTVCYESYDAYNQHIDDDGDYICDRIGCSYSGIKSISTAEELRRAFTVGGKYKLTSDIDLGEEVLVIEYINEEVCIDLDLNGFTITTSYWAGMMIDPNMIVRLSNGTIVGTAPVSGAICCYGTLFLENCTAIGNGYWSVYIQNGTAVINNCTLIDSIGISESDVFITNSDIQTSSGRGCDVLEKSYLLCDFDVTDYTGHVVNNTNNNDGTWTVTSTDFNREIPTKPTFEEFPFVIAPVITGVELFGEGITLDGNTYTAVIPEGQAQIYVSVRITGRFLDLIDKNYLYNCKFSLNNLGNYEFGVFDYEEDGSRVLYRHDINVHEILMNNEVNNILYSNDGGYTWIDTGYTIVVVRG